MCAVIGLVALPFSKVTVNVLDIIIVGKLSPFKLLCLPPLFNRSSFVTSEE